MNKPPKSLMKELTGKLADEGLVVRAGWVGLASLIRDLPDDQQYALRMAFYLGAQHVFSSIFNFLSEETLEETDEDLDRMDKLYRELLDAEGACKSWINIRRPS